MDILRAIAVLVASIVIASAIFVAVLVDATAGHASTASARLGACMSTVQPMVHTLEFIDGRC